MSDSPVVMHASAVAMQGRGLLIKGASGAGKSGLALELMALGATLVADDRTILRRDGPASRLSCPAPISGLIEARGLGLLHADTVQGATLWAVVDLDETETERLPPRRHTQLLGIQVSLVHNVPSRSFPAALLQYLLRGRKD